MPIIFDRFHVSSEEVKSEDLTTQPLDFYEKYEDSEDKVFVRKFVLWIILVTFNIRKKSIYI